MQGGRIQASIPKSLFSRHENAVQEFNMYIMTHFIVVDKKLMPKTTENKWTLNFSNRTTVVPVVEPAFPIELFRFRNLSDLLMADPLDCSQLIDVIAEVIGKEEPRDITTVTGRPTKRMALKIQDLELNTLEAVLFGSLVDQILPHMEEGRVEPLIVVFQLFRANRWKEKTSVQSHYATSKLHINPALPDVIEFRTRLLGDHPSDSVRIAQVSSNSGSAAISDLRRGVEKVKRIEELMKIQDQGQFWIAGRIMSINAGPKDWYYAAHKVCHKKVEEKGEIYHCKKDVEDIELKYKIEIVVCDGTGGVSLLLWDSQVILLCGKSAEQVKIEAGIRVEEYPATLDRMIEKDLLFRVHVRSGHLKGTDNVYSVAAVCDDSELVEMNLPDDFDLEGFDCPNLSLDDSATCNSKVCPTKRSCSETKHESYTKQSMARDEELQHSSTKPNTKGLKRGRMNRSDEGN